METLTTCIEGGTKHATEIYNVRYVYDDEANVVLPCEQIGMVYDLIVMRFFTEHETAKPTSTLGSHSILGLLFLKTGSTAERNLRVQG